MRIFRFFTGRDISLGPLAGRVRGRQWAGDAVAVYRAMRTVLNRRADAALLQFLASGDNREDYLFVIVQQWIVLIEAAEGEGSPDLLFDRLRDRRIRLLLQTAEGGLQQKLENVLADWLAPVADSREARRRLPAAARRGDAFAMAFSKWLARLRSDWQWAEAAGLKTLFEKILLDECSTEIRRSDSQRAQFNRRAQHNAPALETLQELRSVSGPDGEQLAQSLAELRSYDPWCYALIEWVAAGYSYAEIAGMEAMFGSYSADQLRHRAAKCKDKLVKYWKSI